MEVIQAIGAGVVLLGLQYFTKQFLVVKGKAENLNSFSTRDAETKARRTIKRPEGHPLRRLRHLPFKAHPDSKSTFSKDDLLVH